MPPSSPPIYANAIIPDPHMAHIIAAISGTRAASSAPLAPVASSQIVQIEDSSDEDISVRPPVISSTSAAATPLRVIDIEDSSDEDIPSRTSINTSVQTPSRILPERVLVIEDSSEDEGAKDLWPKPGTHYREYNHKDRKELWKELSRMSKRVQAKEARDQQSRHVSSTSSYADDGTIGLIANLCIDDNGSEFFYLLCYCTSSDDMQISDQLRNQIPPVHLRHHIASRWPRLLFIFIRPPPHE